MHDEICGSVVPEPRQERRGKAPCALPPAERKPIHLSFLLMATIVFFAGGTFTPAFSFGSTGESSWSFYGNYDYSQNDDVEDAGFGHSPDADRKQKNENQSEKSRIAEQREKFEQDVPDPRQRFDSYDVNDPEYSEYLTKFTYVLYYGGFDSKVSNAILSVEPTLLITNYDAISPEMRNEFAKNNVTVVAYLPIHWTDRPIDAVLQEARSLLEDGADGLFIDEAASVSTDWEFWYHGRIYETAKEFDEDAVVIINPGSGSIAERSMQVADIICFEHEWRDIASLSWASDYPGWRFMGISSNEFVRVMGYHVGADSARDDLDEARSLNIAYHYSADHYIWLPSWLDVYGGIATSLHPVGDYIDLDLSPVARPPDAKPDEVEDSSQQPELPEEMPDTVGDENQNDTSTEPDTPVNVPERPDPADDEATGANKPPKARAGDDQFIEVAESPVTVHLDGKASSDPDSKDHRLSFSWKQIEGPKVELHESDSKASFLVDPALVVESDVEFGFELTASDVDNAEDSDSVSVVASIKKVSPEGREDGDIDNATNAETEPAEDDKKADPPKDVPKESNSTKTASEVEILAKDESGSNSTAPAPE
jgi:hypothetical protein